MAFRFGAIFGSFTKRQSANWPPDLPAWMSGAITSVAPAF